MSESRTQLEEILELLLAEENEKAEEMLHEYVVAKARAEYEKVLDEDVSEEVAEESEEAVEESEESEEEAVEEAEESEEEAVEETISDSDPAGSFTDEIARDIEEVEGDEMEEEEGDEEETHDGDLEDKVDEIEDELEDLKAEFEKLLADEEEGDEPKDEDEAEMDMEDELDLESVEYDLDGEDTFEDTELEEATKLSNNVAAPSAPADDNKDAPLPSGGSKVEKSGSPVKSKDGGEGNHGDSAKDHTPTDNINVDQKSV